MDSIEDFALNVKKKAPLKKPVHAGQVASEHHEALDLHVGASKTEIKRAYRAKSLLHHPDRNPGDPEAAERFKKVHEAYDALMRGAVSPEERRKTFEDECGEFAWHLACMGRKAEQLCLSKLRETAANRKVPKDVRALARERADAIEKYLRIIRKKIGVAAPTRERRPPRRSARQEHLDEKRRDARHEYLGQIAAIDKDTITFVAPPGKARTERTFPLDKKPLFIVAGKRATLGDFKAGMFALAGYNTLGVVQVVRARKGKGS